MVFDDERQVIGGPEWDEIMEAFHALPLERRQAPAPGPDPVLEEWRTIVLSEKGATGPRSVHRYADAQVLAPCEGCEAWCCKRLVFNRGLPGDASQLEFLRYCLGFPGVEIGIASDSWAVIVHTTCRHLDGNRCSVYGTDERPLRCGYYNALDCKYRSHFGSPRPDEIIRVSRDQFATVADSMVFDELGRIVAMPPMDVMRNRIEETERATARAQLEATSTGGV